MRLRSRKDQRQHPILEKAEDQQAEDVDAGVEPAA
jgi:hypothetical protein